MIDFENIDDIPSPIRDFYTLQEFREETGRFIEEHFTYQDEYGKTHTGTRLVPEYKFVKRVVPCPVKESKSMDDVWQVAQLHRGKRDDLIRSFLEMVNNGTLQRFHHAYLRWYQDKPDVKNPAFYETQGNPEAQPNFSQDLYDAAVMVWESQEPQRPELIAVDQWFIDNAPKLRNLAYPPIEEQMRMRFEDELNGTTTWRDAMQLVNTQYPLQANAL